jgi:hypothetical protein
MTTTAPSSPALRLGVLVLTVATAGIHLYLGLSSGLPLFVLNGLGYLMLLAALYLPIPRLCSPTETPFGGPSSGSRPSPSSSGSS